MAGHCSMHWFLKESPGHDLLDSTPRVSPDVSEMPGENGRASADPPEPTVAGPFGFCLDDARAWFRFVAQDSCQRLDPQCHSIDRWWTFKEWGFMGDDQGNRTLPQEEINVISCLSSAFSASKTVSQNKPLFPIKFLALCILFEQHKTSQDRWGKVHALAAGSLWKLTGHGRGRKKLAAHHCLHTHLSPVSWAIHKKEQRGRLHGIAQHPPDWRHGKPLMLITQQRGKHPT